ncbi:MAG: SPOR domain-containing protein, partial [Flavobacteriales bacterium]|nr:SPOR domain-containing protein [Flavobacteriales bacterium]
ETNNNKQITNNKEVASNNQQQETNNNKQIANDKSQITNEEIPEKLTNSIFSLTSANQSAYSNSKPIPKNPKMPEGLVFKVQIGAFRNPIPQDLFKGFTPVMAEDAGNGITRYTAGLFTSFNVANEAKNSIREIGYPDAFVVAFFNGKRININEARAMLNEPNNNLQTSDNNAQVVDNKSLPIAIGTNNNSQTSRTNETETLSTTEEVKDGISKDVRNIDGIFYTVQVGVYSKEITAGQLNNLSPINSERTANGLIRYTSGIYKNLDEANAAKDRIRNIGISDAFVIAYHNGKKITVTQASDLLKKGVETSSY